MSWWTIEVRAPIEQRDQMGAWLVARSGQGVEEREDGTLVAFTPDEQAAQSLMEELSREVGAVDAQSHQLDSPDWAARWRDGLGPRRVGPLTIVPSWLPEASHPDPLTIVLDPETAFGSGEHGSTRAALTLLSRLLQPADRVLDLGSGSGILAIAAVKLGAARAIGIELDSDANEIATRNAARNGVTDRIEFFEGDAADFAPLIGPADLLVSNILRLVNTALLPAITAALRPAGRAIFSGMEYGEANQFRSALSHAGFTIVQETLDADWWGVGAERPQ